MRESDSTLMHTDLHDHVCPRRLSENAPTARALSVDLDSGTDMAAGHVELVGALQKGDLQRVGAAIRLHVETGERLPREALEQAGTVL